jgi:hypothetical protein
MAFVALDIRVVAYVAVKPGFVTVWHIDPPGDYLPSTNIFGPKTPRSSRKTFDEFSFDRAVGEIGL